MTQYENQAVQPTADILNKNASVLDRTTIDYIINGATEAKAKAQLKDSKVLEQFKEVDSLPDTEKNIVLKVVSALVRDYKTSLSYKTAS